MAVGDRIKRARNLRGMTQKELGIAIGFEEKSADIRIAQYESNTRTPKEELLRKIAEVLDVNYRSLYEPTLYAAEDVMYTLFELDEHYPGTRLYEVTDTTDPDFPEKHMAVSFRYRLLDEFLKEWQLRKKPGGRDHQGRVSGMEAQLASDRRRLRPVRAEEKVA